MKVAFLFWFDLPEEGGLATLLFKQNISHCISLPSDVSVKVPDFLRHNNRAEFMSLNIVIIHECPNISGPELQILKWELSVQDLF